MASAWRKYWKRHKRDIIRYAIVVVAALVVAFLAAIITSVIDRPMNVYYPHDEQRRQRVLPAPIFPQSSIHTFEDEHKQGVEHLRRLP